MRITAFGVNMPLLRFLEELGPLFILPIWPLLVIATLLQIMYLRRVGAFDDRRAWKIGFAVLLSPLLAVAIRLFWLILGIPDVAPFAIQGSTSMYSGTVTASTLVAVFLGYGVLTLLTLVGKRGAA